MTENEGVFLSAPTYGLGFHTASALQRLGKKIMGFVEGPIEEKATQSLKILPLLRASAAPLPLSSHPFSTLMVTHNDSLAQNRALTAAEVDETLQLFKRASLEQPEAHLVIALPNNTSDHLIEKIRQSYRERITLLLTPAIFSFRDHNVMDIALEAFRKNPVLLQKELMRRHDTPMVFAGDVAAFLVSLPQKKNLLGKIIRVPAAAQNLAQFQNLFLKSFLARSERKPNWLDQIKALRSTNPLDAAQVESELEAQRSQLPSENALDVFPTTLTSLQKSLEQSAAQFSRAPELEMHFPPGRAL